MTSRVTYTFSAGQAGPQTTVEGEGSAPASLAEQLAECVSDTGTPAAELARETSRKAQEWIFGRALTWEANEAASMLEGLLSALEAKHGWRGIMATWIDQVRGTFANERAREGGALRSLLAEEMGLWLDVSGELRAPMKRPTPLSDDPRTTPARAIAPHVLRGMDAGETILVIGWTPELVECCRAAHRAGLSPEVLIPIGHPELIGRGMARDAARFGLSTRLILDAALWDAARAVDRVWVGSESIGLERTVTPAGVTGILEVCADEEVPLELLATTDACHPSGDGVSAPLGDPDRVWGDRPEGVEVDAAAHESVPTRSFTRWYCEHGAVLNAEGWGATTARPEPCAPKSDSVR